MKRDRSNYRWGMIPGEKREYGRCNIEVDSSIRRAEPPEAVMGDIARTHFYMAWAYGFSLSDQQRRLFEAWDRQDPPDAWGRERNRRITAIQGIGNPFIEPGNDVGPGCGSKTTCGEMTSCAEARFYLEQCGISSLDGDGDGMPCEALCK